MNVRAMMLTPVVDTAAPWSLGAVLAVVGVVITWILGAIAIRRFVLDERKRRRDDDGHLEKLIEKVCKAFTESDSYQMRRDRNMISVAQSVTDEAFRLRSASFVDAGVDLERRTELARRLEAIEKAVNEMRSDFKAAAASIAKEVAKEMRGGA